MFVAGMEREASMRSPHSSLAQQKLVRDRVCVCVCVCACVCVRMCATLSLFLSLCCVSVGVCVCVRVCTEAVAEL